ncbi:hypothetical protein QYF61_000577 [Mycteria americana]|uniref:Uncharacterized protein n=1 Tax=Mycteria americana TaxID=33587 RepID=A0AAN7PG55_MYCAM|nr:hypothetical protein QYF61_000577 [Mycteria americana]
MVLFIYQLTKIPEELSKLVCLRQLDISHNADSIGELEHVLCLTANNNYIGQLPKSITPLTNLQQLDLSSMYQAFDPLVKSSPVLLSEKEFRKQGGHRITESYRLEKTSKIIESNRKPTLPKPPLNHVPKHLIQMSFKYFQGWQLNHFPGQPVPMLDNPFREEKFPNIQSKPPLVQLEAISLILSLVTWEKRPTPTSLQPPFR